MGYEQVEIQALKAVHSDFLDRVIAQNEITEVPIHEAERWIGCGYAQYPPPPEADDDSDEDVDAEPEPEARPKKKATKKK